MFLYRDQLVNKTFQEALEDFHKETVVIKGEGNEGRQSIRPGSSLGTHFPQGQQQTSMTCIRPGMMEKVPCRIGNKQVWAI
jgi:hypothetical protein